MTTDATPNAGRAAAAPAHALYPEVDPGDLAQRYDDYRDDAGGGGMSRAEAMSHALNDVLAVLSEHADEAAAPAHDGLREAVEALAEGGRRMSANILRGCEAADCHRTWSLDNDGRNGATPRTGTHGEKGDVRLCEHGKVWTFVRCEAYKIDVWRRVSRFWEPLTHRRARAALDEAPADQEPT